MEILTLTWVWNGDYFKIQLPNGETITKRGRRQDIVNEYLRQGFNAPRSEIVKFLNTEVSRSLIFTRNINKRRRSK